VAWLRDNRGDAEVDPDEPIEPGMDPVASAVKHLLTEKAAKASGEVELARDPVQEFQLHDVLHGILRLEKAWGRLAISPEQAKVLLPLTNQAAESRNQEVQLYQELFEILSKDQVAWIRQDSQRTEMNVNKIILRYGQLVLKQ